MRKTLTWRYVLLGALACATVIGCGDDDDASDGGASGNDGGAANGGNGGARAGSGGRGGRGGAGAGGSRAGSGGTGGSAGTGMMMAMCSEPKPTQPVVCGGQTCNAPTGFMNECIVPCCVNQGGAEVCGSKSTNPMYPSTECQLPATEDPSCDDIESNGMMFQGCCNAAQGKCGIISTVRPGCITMSQAVMLPNPLKSCSAGGDDGGTEDAGL